MPRRPAAILALLAVGLLAGCILPGRKAMQPGLPNPALQPTVEREFRAAWIATVANINWPSKPGLSTQQQQQEAIALLDLLAARNFNAAVFQVRPQCDALYASPLEPWSYFLTGTQGQAPEPYYDPLQFWVEQAHQRGIELHVWINPYRAHHIRGGEITPSSIVSTRPELVVALESGYYWMDPALQGTQDHSLAVVLDIVQRYDIDGVHFDDYFYPYPSYHNGKDFPDDKSWAAYRQDGGKLARDDWRRAAVDRFIKRLYKAIKNAKPQVKFGLSPFGIWRPHNPASIRGLDQYHVLYADARRWFNEGWIDYWSPQLYWPTNQIPQSFPVLLGWWAGENKKNRHFWPGISIGRGGRNELGIDEVLNQIMITRGMLPQSPGVIHWNIGTLQNEELATAILAGPYKKPALVPPSPWLDDKAPQAPRVFTQMAGDQLEIRWWHEQMPDVFRWVVYYQRDGIWDYTLVNRQYRSLSLPLFTVNMKKLEAAGGPEQSAAIKRALRPLTAVAVSAVDRLGNESRIETKTLAQTPHEAGPTQAQIKAQFAAWKSPRPVRRGARIKLGLEVLLEDHLDLIAGKRVGLVTNPAAVDANLRSTIDILAQTEGVDLVALLGAENGVRGTAPDPSAGDGAVDPQTGIPVYSLAGTINALRQEWLKGLDALLFDIQGVGSAWHNSHYSLSFALEACARAGIPLIVLDRPNPLGGRVVEGPLLDLGGSFPHPLPLRHGMTYGELAAMRNQTQGYGAALTVIPMQGWRRSMLWDDTDLLWVMPAPEIGTFATAVVHPGQSLFEWTNISAGHGTTKPFLMVGAPWIDCQQAAADLNDRGLAGALFRPARFTPQQPAGTTAGAGKPWNQPCCGIEIMLTDPTTYRSVEAALHIIDALRQSSPDALVWNLPERLQYLDDPNSDIATIVEQAQEQVAGFIEQRGEFLLYR